MRRACLSASRKRKRVVPLPRRALTRRTILSRPPRARRGSTSAIARESASLRPGRSSSLRRRGSCASASRARAFTADELVAVLDAAATRDRLLFDTLAETGVRWGELAEVRGRDLKATDEGPRLSIRRAYSSVRITGADGERTRTGVVKLPKGDHGRRDIPLSPALARRLWRLQRKPDELLFTAPDGGRLNYHNAWNRILSPTLETAGIEWAAGFHTFRHTCASLLFAAGRNPKQVQRWLGHAKASFTLDTYVHLLADGMGEALTLPTSATGGTQGAPKATEIARNAETDETSEIAVLQAER
jgi:integrase